MILAPKVEGQKQLWDPRYSPPKANSLLGRGSTQGWSSSGTTILSSDETHP